MYAALSFEWQKEVSQQSSGAFISIYFFISYRDCRYFPSGVGREQKQFTVSTQNVQTETAFWPKQLANATLSEYNQFNLYTALFHICRKANFPLL